MNGWTALRWAFCGLCLGCSLNWAAAGEPTAIHVEEMVVEQSAESQPYYPRLVHPVHRHDVGWATPQTLFTRTWWLPKYRPLFNGRRMKKATNRYYNPYFPVFQKPLEVD